MIDVKCKACNKLLGKANIMVAAIKCPRCKMVFEYKIFSNDLYDNSLNIDKTKSINKIS
jgi:phage FluMu protein Com